MGAPDGRDAGGAGDRRSRGNGHIDLLRHSRDLTGHRRLHANREGFSRHSADPRLDANRAPAEDRCPAARHDETARYATDRSSATPPAPAPTDSNRFSHSSSRFAFWLTECWSDQSGPGVPGVRIENCAACELRTLAASGLTAIDDRRLIED